MRHLLVSYHTCPFEEPGTGLSGGMNVFLRGLLPALAEVGVETDVLTRAPGPASFTTSPWDGVRIVHLPCAFPDPPERVGAWEALPAFVEEARRWLASHEVGAGYDAASAHYWMSGVALRGFWRGASAISFHTVEARKALVPGYRPDRMAVVRVAEESNLAREAGAVVFLTEADRAGTERLLTDGTVHSVVIPPGVDAIFAVPSDRDASRDRLGIKPGSPVFLLVARKVEGKGTGEAVARFSAWRERTPGAADAILLVAGQDAPAGDMREAVRHLGPVPHVEMPDLYASADALIFPSRYESFGMAPLEAMACGTPVVVPRGGFWGEVVTERGGGIACDMDGAGGFEASLNLAASPGFRNRCSDAAVRVASGFSWGLSAMRWARLLSTFSRPDSRR